jgi:hypothetical protein
VNVIAVGVAFTARVPLLATVVSAGGGGASVVAASVVAASVVAASVVAASVVIASGGVMLVVMA